MVFVFAITELVARLLLCSLNLTSSRELRTINLGIPNEFLHIAGTACGVFTNFAEGQIFSAFLRSCSKAPGPVAFFIYGNKRNQKNT